jgi:hypothetical protein
LNVPTDIGVLNVEELDNLYRLCECGWSIIARAHSGTLSFYYFDAPKMVLALIISTPADKNFGYRPRYFYVQWSQWRFVMLSKSSF